MALKLNFTGQLLQSGLSREVAALGWNVQKCDTISGLGWEQ